MATPRGLGDPNVSYLGLVTGERRIELLQNAAALVSATFYLEPGANVAVESMMCGTPVLATDWGVFTESINHGVSGYRCRSLAEFSAAAYRIIAGNLPPAGVRAWAVGRYSEDAVRPLWWRYFERINQSWHDEGLARWLPASL